ncbi:MAG: ATP-binding cassette domain-containing protein [Bacilli bacterium]|jgi:sodium transport system ATP-binding protein|nr:ATP-binding cassette domain-containing protein [Bacilli bacterium]
MLEVKDLRKKFVKITKDKKKVEFYADDGISFKAEKGQVVGVLGPNGAGKTTLLRMIGGILEPTEGTVLIDNLNYRDNELEIKERIAYLSGNTKIYNTLSCYELMKMCGNIYGVSEKDLEKRIKDISKKLNMEEFLYNKIGNLSTGQTQRVNIARCLVHNPSYYILDEATSGLDIISSQVILNFIKEEKKKGKTILYSTHYMEEAENICDYVIMINKGVIIKEGTPEDIKKSTKVTNLRDAFFALIDESDGEVHEK